MPVERSAGAILFRKEKEKTLFLLLHYEEGHWDFPKGHIETGEKTEETVLREVREETGITELTFIDGFKETIRYFFQTGKKRVLKFVVFYLAQTSQKKVTLSHEHVGAEWLLYQEAVERMTFPSSRKLLRKAHSFLA